MCYQQGKVQCHCHAEQCFDTSPSSRAGGHGLTAHISLRVRRKRRLQLLGPSRAERLLLQFPFQKLAKPADHSQLKERPSHSRGSNPGTSARKTQAQGAAAARRTLLSAAALGKERALLRTRETERGTASCAPRAHRHRS